MSGNTSGHIKRVKQVRSHHFWVKVIVSSYDDADCSLASVLHIKGPIMVNWLTVELVQEPERYIKLLHVPPPIARGTWKCAQSRRDVKD